MVLIHMGCATATLAQGNHRYTEKNRVPVIANIGIVEGQMYSGEKVNVVEMKTNDGSFFIEMSNERNALLTNNKRDKLQDIGGVKVCVFDKQAFDEAQIYFGNGKTGEYIYVVSSFARDGEIVKITSGVKIYAKLNGEIYKYEYVKSDVSVDTGSKIVLGMRRLGYLVTVPLDIATAPIFIGVILIAGSSNGFEL